MNHSETLDLLAAALSTAQGEFESVAKDASNPFFKSAYASLPAVVQAASPILAANGLSVTQVLEHDEHGDTLTTALLHKSGQYLSGTMSLRPVKNDPQAQGSATTYGRRYAYMAVLGLVADDDDDGNAGSSGQASKPAAQPKPKAAPAATPKPAMAAPAVEHEHTITDEAMASLKALYKASGWDNAAMHWQLIACDALPSGAGQEGIGEALRHLSPQNYETVCSALLAEAESKGST